MSNSTPVGAVVNEAVQFVLHRWGAVFRFFFAPVLLSVVLFSAFAASVIDQEKAAAAGEIATIADFLAIVRLPLPTVIFMGLVATSATALLLAGAAASLYRLVALGEDRPGYFQVRVDGPAARVFLASIILGVISLVIWGAAAAIAQAIGGGSPLVLMKEFANFYMEVAATGDEPDDIPPELRQAFIDHGASFALWCFMGLAASLYAGVKLAPFAPGAAIENRLILLKSVRMTTGHAWSILGSLTLLAAFTFIIALIAGLAINIINQISGLLMSQGAGLALVGLAFSAIVVAGQILIRAFTTGAQGALLAIIYRRLETGE